MELKINNEYKMFAVSSFMAHTQMSVFKVVGHSENTPIIVMKNHKGNWERKKKLLGESKEYIIIPLNDCILKADSETGSFTGNACFNFMNTETEIKEQLKLNLNDSFETDLKFNRVIVVKDDKNPYAENQYLEVAV